MSKGCEVLDGTPRRAGAPQRHNLAELLHMMGTDRCDAGCDAGCDRKAASEYPLTVRQLPTGASLFHAGAQAEALYFVSVGLFKCFTTAEDGYEQVLGFGGRGEVLGFDAISTGQHPTGAVALEDARVYVLPLRDVLAPDKRLPGLDRMLYAAASRQLALRGDIADVMAAVAAEVRLARFLVQLSARMEACGQSPRRLLLRMSRRDIASHLGVAHETVSRSFGALAEWGYVRVNYREVEILDVDALKAYARSTRGQLDEAPGRARRSMRPLTVVA